MLELAQGRFAKSKYIFFQHILQEHHIDDLTSTKADVFSTSGKIGKGYNQDFFFSLKITCLVCISAPQGMYVCQSSSNLT